MKTITASTGAVLLMMLTGCAGTPIRMGQATPAELSQESNYNLCRAAFSRHSNQAIDAEIASRRLDCSTYAAAIAQREAAADAALSNFSNQMQRNRPVNTNCNTYGNTVNCRSY